MDQETGNEINTEFGKVTISEELLATLAGQAAIECYGLVGMSSRKLRDGLAVLLKKENLSRGVKVHFEENKLVIDLYIIVSYGTRIPEVAANVMDKVRYVIEKATGLEVSRVNVNVQGVQAAGKQQPGGK